MRCGLCVAALLLTAASAIAQPHPNRDFEDGLRGWTSEGAAFAGQPTAADAVDPRRFPASPLGGDYWQSTRYPLGHHDRFLVASDDPQQGTLTSDAFPLGPSDRFFSILIGGSGVGTGPRIELQVTTADAGWTVAWQTGVPGIDLLQQRVYEIPPALTGRQARIV